MRKHVLWAVAAASVVTAGLWVAPMSAASSDAVVERAVFTFNEPVRVEQKILMGSYVIEHDEGRMARGEPCTHIYQGTSLENPGPLVVAFHCVHLDRAPAAAPTVIVSRSASVTAGFKRLDEFQYAGSAAGHGVPR